MVIHTAIKSEIKTATKTACYHCGEVCVEDINEADKKFCVKDAGKCIYC